MRGPEAPRLRHAGLDGGMHSGVLRVRRAARLARQAWVELRAGELRVWDGRVKGTGRHAWAVRVAECACVEERRGGVWLGGGAAGSGVWLGGEGVAAWVEAVKEAFDWRLERFYLVQRDSGRGDGLIGKGHYADVFRAVDRETGELVAVKAVRKAGGAEGAKGGGGTAALVAAVLGGAEKAETEGGKGRTGKRRAKRQTATAAHIDREAEILRAVSHRNVVRCLDQFETSSALYLVMELAPNGTLADVFESATAMCEDDARELLRPLLRAVVYLHDNHIVHRDIKPDNVLLDKNGELKLADFGLSRILPDPVLHPREYSLTSVLGTPTFCAPEVVRKLPYGAAVDCWAVGVVLHLALTGRFPFRAKTPEDVFAALSSRERIPFPRARWACVSPAARDLVRALLNFDPEARLTAREALHHPWVIGPPPPPRGGPAAALEPRSAQRVSLPVPSSASFAYQAAAVANGGARGSFPVSISARAPPVRAHPMPVERRLATAVSAVSVLSEDEDSGAVGRRLESSPQLSVHAGQVFASRMPLPVPPAFAESSLGGYGDNVVFAPQPRYPANDALPTSPGSSIDEDMPESPRGLEGPPPPTQLQPPPFFEAPRRALPTATRRVQSFRPSGATGSFRSLAIYRSSSRQSNTSRY